MTTHLKIINYDPEAIAREIAELEQKHETERKSHERKFFLTIAVSLSAIFVGTFASFYSDTAPWLKLLYIPSGILTVCSGLCAAALVYYPPAPLDSLLSTGMQYHRFLQDKTLLDVQYTVLESGNQCEVVVSAADENHTVQKETFLCNVVTKTDVTEPTLDVAAGTVYIPYEYEKRGGNDCENATTDHQLRP